MPQLRKPHRWATEGRSLADAFQASGDEAANVRLSVRDEGRTPARPMAADARVGRALYRPASACRKRRLRDRILAVAGDNPTGFLQVVESVANRLFSGLVAL